MTTEVDYDDTVTLIMDGVPVTFDPWDLWDRHFAAPAGSVYLTPKEVWEMRLAYHSRRVMAKELARRYNISVRGVYRIVWGHAYECIPMPDVLREKQ